MSSSWRSHEDQRRRIGIRNFVGAFLIFLGILFAGVGWWSLRDARQFAATAQRAQGVVTRIVWVDRGVDRRSRSSSTYPRVRFQAEGRTVEIQGRTGSSPPAYSGLPTGCTRE